MPETVFAAVCCAFTERTGASTALAAAPIIATASRRLTADDSAASVMDASVARGHAEAFSEAAQHRGGFHPEHLPSADKAERHGERERQRGGGKRLAPNPDEVEGHHPRHDDVCGGGSGAETEQSGDRAEQRIFDEHRSEQ